MATRKYNVPRGGTRDADVTEATGSAITSGLLQVTVDLAVTATKKDVLLALDTVARKIRKGNWPPA